MFRLKRLTDNKGVTLVEVLIATMLFMMLMATVGSVFVQMFRMQDSVLETSELNGMVDSIANPIIEELLNASDADVMLGSLGAVNKVVIPRNSMRVTYSVHTAADCGTHTCHDCDECSDCAVDGCCADPDTCPKNCLTDCLSLCPSPCTIPRGILLRNNEPVFTPEYYNRKTITFTFDSPRCLVYVCYCEDECVRCGEDPCVCCNGSLCAYCADARHCSCFCDINAYVLTVTIFERCRACAVSDVCTHTTNMLISREYAVRPMRLIEIP